VILLDTLDIGLATLVRALFAPRPARKYGGGR
jgi:hypothetical protein